MLLKAGLHADSTFLAFYKFKLLIYYMRWVSKMVFLDVIILTMTNIWKLTMVLYFLPIFVFVCQKFKYICKYLVLLILIFEIFGKIWFANRERRFLKTNIICLVMLLRKMLQLEDDCVIIIGSWLDNNSYRVQNTVCLLSVVLEKEFWID